MTLRPIAALAASLLFASAAHAGAAETLIAAINKCAAIADNGMRHSCYDKLPTVVQSLAPVVTAEAQRATVPQPTTAPTIPPAAPPAAATPSAAPPPAMTPPAALPPTEDKGTLSGLWGMFDGEPVPADHIAATVESFTFDYGVFVVTLDNGQVWRQVAAVGDLVHLGRDHKDRVAIWRDDFGKYVLRIEGYHTKYHVKRIK